MKPHPRLRNTFKWGGVALTTLLVMGWIVSGQWHVNCLLPDGVVLNISNGVLSMDIGSVDHVFSNYGADSYFERGWHVGPAHINAGCYYDRGYHLTWWGWGPSLPYICSYAVPVWVLILPTVAVSAVAWRQDAASRRCPRFHCFRCGYDLTGLPANGLCPECGSKMPRFCGREHGHQ